MLLRCDNCGTERHDIFSRTTGDLLQRWYEHPEGYSDVEPMTSAERRALFAAIVQRNQPSMLADPESATVTPIGKRKRA